MLSRTPQPQRRLFDGFWPSARTVGIMPGLKAFGGLSILGRRDQPSPANERLGSLEVRFARTAAEVRQAQRLRYQVFYRDGGAIADMATRLARRDVDAFDAICDHLLVIDHDAQDVHLQDVHLQGAQLQKVPLQNARARDANGRPAPAVVGTYRLLRQAVAREHGGFYTSIEYDIAPLIARQPQLQFLELGRSCVLGPYRNKRTLELLWRGIGAYTAQHQPDVMIGCASFDGTDPDRLAGPLSFLHHFARAPEVWRASARADRYVEMNRIPKERIKESEALRALPPLIKGYLRLGAYIGDGAVVDHQFGTTDVLIILPVAQIKARYLSHFSAQREAA